MCLEWDDVDLGVIKGTVRLADSQPGWVRVYDQLASALRPAVDGLALSIEHVGSTSVPGLVAKPIVDIAVGLTADAELVDVVEALKPLGYEFRGDKGDGGGWFFVLDSRPLYRVAYVHAVRHGGRQWREYLQFRNRLRSDPDARRAYVELKRRLAAEYADDRDGYTAAKASFIGSFLSNRLT